MKLLTVIGARPQFIKVAPMERAINELNRSAGYEKIHSVVVHTGQHFDRDMSHVFFEELDISEPAYHLGIGGLSHGAMTGRMLEALEGILEKEKPDCLLVYGDTNSTLAGALAASKLGIPVAHVEAGLRSNRMTMPEEQNRVLTDRLSDWLFCPTQVAVENLKKEGFPFLGQRGGHQTIELSGDVMFDAVLNIKNSLNADVILADLKERFGISGPFVLCTLHRQENTDNPEQLARLVDVINEISAEFPVILPLHPRTKERLARGQTHWSPEVKLIPPLGYKSLQALLMRCRFVMTDSGGLQKEAFFHSKPCFTLRDETEWQETVDTGWNYLWKSGQRSLSLFITQCEELYKTHSRTPLLYGEGNACELIIASLLKTFY